MPSLLTTIFAFGSSLPYPFTFHRPSTSSPQSSTTALLTQVHHSVLSRSPFPDLVIIYGPAFAHLARKGLWKGAGKGTWSPALAYRWVSYCHSFARERRDAYPMMEGREWLEMEKRGGGEEVVDEVIFEDAGDEVWKPEVDGVDVTLEVEKVMVELYYDGFADWYLEGLVEEMSRLKVHLTAENVRQCANLNNGGGDTRQWTFSAVPGLLNLWTRIVTSELRARLTEIKANADRRYAASLLPPPRRTNWRCHPSSVAMNQRCFNNYQGAFHVLARFGWDRLHAWQWVTQEVRNGATPTEISERAHRFPEEKLAVVYGGAQIASLVDAWRRMPNTPDGLADAAEILLREGYADSYITGYYIWLLNRGREDELLRRLSGRGKVRDWLRSWCPFLKGVWDQYALARADPWSFEAGQKRMKEENGQLVREWSIVLKVLAGRGWDPTFAWQVLRPLVENFEGRKGAVLWAAERIDADEAWNEFVVPKIEQVAEDVRQRGDEKAVEFVVEMCELGWDPNHVGTILLRAQGNAFGNQPELEALRDGSGSEGAERWLWKWAPGLWDIWERAGFFDEKQEVEDSASDASSGLL